MFTLTLYWTSEVPSNYCHDCFPGVWKKSLVLTKVPFVFLKQKKINKYESTGSLILNCIIYFFLFRLRGLSEINWDHLASALQFNPSHLRLLDFSDNKLPDSAVELLSGFLQSPRSELKILRSVDTVQLLLLLLFIILKCFITGKFLSTYILLYVFKLCF